MKKLKYTLIALALGICSASAMTLTIHHDTQKKLDFTFDWHDLLSFPTRYDGIASVYFNFDLYPSGEPNVPDYIDFDIYSESPLFHDPLLFFPQRAGLYLAYQPYPSNFIGLPFLEGDLRNNGRNMKLAKDQQSARWTFFEKDYLPAPIQVPEGGSTLLLMGIAMITVIGIRSYQLEKA